MCRFRLATSAGLGGSLSEWGGDDQPVGAVHLVVGNTLDRNGLGDRAQKQLREQRATRQRPGEFADGVGEPAQVTVT